MPNVLNPFPVQDHIGNKIEADHLNKKWLAGIIGDKPSQSAKSPHLWNAAYQALSIDAHFLAFDVAQEKLGQVISSLKETKQLIGGSVTVPYKIAVMEHLDELDPKAKQIGAVNTYARTTEGKLKGFNTDGQGAIDSLTKVLPGQKEPFFKSLTGLKVLLIGAGGAARAVAFYVADAIGTRGQITLANRHSKKGIDLAQSVTDAYGNAKSVSFTEIKGVAKEVDLIINATSVGQAGTRKLSGAKITSFEPYSPLSKAEPTVFDESQFKSDAEFREQWLKASKDDIARNQEESARLMAQIPKSTAVFDVIYAPLETTLLAQARKSGKKTLNGKGMNIAQAADGFVNKVMTPTLKEMGLDIEKTYNDVFETMAKIW